MNIVKTKLRKKIEDDILKHWLVIFIEREMTKTFSINTIIDTFHNMKNGEFYFRF